MSEIRILDQDEDVVELEFTSSSGLLWMIGRVGLLDESVAVSDVHIDGPGAGSLGLAGVRAIAQAIMETYGVERIEIRGFRRTTGAAPGRTPKPLVSRKRGD